MFVARGLEYALGGDWMLLRFGGGECTVGLVRGCVQGRLGWMVFFFERGDWMVLRVRGGETCRG